jgi:hypothetical protein
MVCLFCCRLPSCSAAANAAQAVEKAQRLAQWARDEAPRRAEAGAATVGKATGLTLALQVGMC